MALLFQTAHIQIYYIIYSECHKCGTANEHNLHLFNNKLPKIMSENFYYNEY